MTERNLTWRKKLRYALLTGFVYFIYGFFRLLPVEAASSLGGFILERLGPFLHHTRVARQNLSDAFPEKSHEEREKIMRGMWNNLGRVMAEYPHLHRLWPKVEYAGRNYYAEVREKGGPAFFFGGHIGNWEISTIGAKETGLPLHVVYRKPNNPWVDGLLRHARGAGASAYIVKGREGAREMLSVMKRGGVIAMLVDQKLNEGLPVPFFGREAMTAEAIAYFALKFGCPLYPTRVERLGGARFRLTTYDPLVINKTSDKKGDLRAIMLEINKLLENWIRERPEQWLWIHRRWPETRLNS